MSLAAFESVTCLGDEAKDAKKTIPRVIFTCLLPLGLMYLFMAYVLVACFQGAPVSLSQAEAPFDQLALACNLPFFGTIVCGGVAMSFFACALGCTNAAARVLYSMAQNGHFFAPMGRAHPHNATPHRAIALIAVVAFLTPAVLLVSGIKLFDCIGYLAQISSFGYIVSYFLLTLAMPFYLLSVKAFRPWHIALLTATLLIVGFSIFGSLFPVPPAPWNYLPYIFAGIVGSGVVLSFSLKSRVKPDQS
jgi:amino acid transporter